MEGVVEQLQVQENTKHVDNELTIKCNNCSMNFPYEDFQRPNDVPLKSCILCRKQFREKRQRARQRKKIEKEEAKGLQNL